MTRRLRCPKPRRGRGPSRELNLRRRLILAPSRPVTQQRGSRGGCDSAVRRQATAKKRGRPKKALGLEAAKTPKMIKTSYKAERPAWGAQDQRQTRQTEEGADRGAAGMILLFPIW